MRHIDESEPVYCDELDHGTLAFRKVPQQLEQHSAVALGIDPGRKPLDRFVVKPFSGIKTSGCSFSTVRGPVVPCDDIPGDAVQLGWDSANLALLRQ